MISLRSGLVGLVLVVLAAGWLFLYTHSHAVHPELQDAILSQVKDVKQLDSTWDVDVLKSQADINKSYDPLTRPLGEFAGLLAILDAEVMSSGDRELTSDLRDLHAAIDAKTVSIDRFKAADALLKNSLRYVPTVNREIQDDLRGRRADAFAQPTLARLGPLVRFSGEVSTLVGDVLAYNAVPDSESQARLSLRLAHVSGSAGSYPAEVRGNVDSLLLHLRAILRFRASESQSLQEIAAIPVAAKSDAFARAVTRRFNSDLAGQSTYQRWLLLYSGVVLMSLFGLAALIVHRSATERRRLLTQVAHKTRELKEASLTDPLTGLRNRRFLQENIELDVAACLRRYDDWLAHPLAAPLPDADLIFYIVDIDYFKAVNDTYGHAAGDAVLIEIRDRLRAVTRDADYLVRWGGEEFLIVVRHADRSNAEMLAERIRSVVGTHVFELPGGTSITKTCSVGFACYPFAPHNPRMLSWSDVVQLADHELYRVKGGGRNGWAGFFSTDVSEPENITLTALLQQVDERGDDSNIRFVRSA